MTLRISVVIPTHDRPEHLLRAAESLLAQSRPPDEVIIVDDGRRPVPAEVGLRLAAAQIPWRCRRRSPPSASASRNCGLRMATGDVVLLMDDDTRLESGYLAALAELYALDPHGVVAGIGARYTEPFSVRQAAWNLAAGLLGRNAWAPRRCAARYARLPRALGGRLRVARRLAGGAISIRRRIAEEYSFCEQMSHYTLGEDAEFCFRVGRDHALFVAPELEIVHDPAGGGRPDMFTLGRMLVANSLLIFRRTVEPGAGSSALLALDFAGRIAQHVLWAAMSLRRKNLEFAVGAVAELLSRGRARASRAVFGT